MSGLLSVAIFLPVAGALLLLLVGNRNGERNAFIRQAALGISLLTFVATLALWRGFDPSSADYQFVERASWVPACGARPCRARFFSSSNPSVNV